MTTDSIRPDIQAADMIICARLKIIAINQLFNSVSDTEDITLTPDVRDGLFYIISAITDELRRAIDKLQGGKK